MVFADAVVFAVVTLVPAPVIDVMGGLRHSERDALLAGVTFSVTILSALTAPVWILGALISVAVLKPRWPDMRSIADRGRSHGLLVLAIMSAVAFVPLGVSHEMRESVSVDVWCCPMCQRRWGAGAGQGLVKTAFLACQAGFAGRSPMSA